MGVDRRDFIRLIGFGSATFYLPVYLRPQTLDNSLIKPPRLREGDTVGVLNPSGPTFHEKDLKEVEKRLARLGLKVVFGKHVLSRYGYLAGTDEERASDFNDMLNDLSVKAVFATRGGWGSNRILPLIDYEAIRRHPKILMGFSDITSLLLAIYAKTGMITFYGPVGTSKWGGFTTGWVKKILFDGEQPTMSNPMTKLDGRPTDVHRIKTITSGKAEGRLVGGNLTVISSMLGTGYLPDWRGKLLFLEEIDEKIYRIDRMLTHLKLSGVLEKVSGIIIGKCVNCVPSKTTLSLTLEEIFSDHLRPFGIPVYSGAMIGHIDRIFTLPIGVNARMDAGKGTIELLERSVI